jgi:hypothetical protein
LGSCLLVCVALFARRSGAQEHEPSVGVHWHAPALCPSEADLKQSIEARLGRPLYVGSNLAISAEVQATEVGYSASLRFESPSGVDERVLEHPECGKLLEAVALVIALSIDPGRTITEATTESASSEAQAEPPSRALPPPLARPDDVATDAAAPPARSAAPGAPFEYPISTFALFGARGLPSVGPGIGVGVGLSREHFQVELVGRYWLPRSEPVKDAPSARISIGWLSAEVRGCGVPWLGAWRLRVCAGGGASDFSGEGVGTANSRTRHTLVPTLSSAAFVSRELGGASPFVGLTLDWLLATPRFGVMQTDEIIEVYKTPTIALSGVLGLSYRL